MLLLLLLLTLLVSYMHVSVWIVLGDGFRNACLTIINTIIVYVRAEKRCGGVHWIVINNLAGTRVIITVVDYNFTGLLKHVYWPVPFAVGWRW